MKKILSALIVLSMLLSMTAIYASAEEIVFEESFENGLDNWTYNNMRHNVRNHNGVYPWEDIKGNTGTVRDSAQNSRG